MTIFQFAARPREKSLVAGYFRRFGQVSGETFDEPHLITDPNLSGVEICGDTAAAVRRYLRANNLSGPVIGLPGVRREIHLVTGISRAPHALDALRAAGAIVHTGGAGIALPPTRLPTGATTWILTPGEAHWVPPVVVIATAVRALARPGPDQIPGAA